MNIIINNTTLCMIGTALFLCIFHWYNYAAGVRFKNKTPFQIKVKLLSVYNSVRDYTNYREDPAATFKVEPRKNHFYDAIFSGFRGVEIYVEPQNYLLEFEFHIPGTTGIRDWILTGDSLENISLYIGPTGLDPEIGVIKKYRMSQPQKGVEERYEEYFHY